MIRALLFSWLIFMSQFAFAENQYAAIQEAAVLLDKGESAAAYASLHALRDQHEGDPAFDFLYGLAALEAGHYQQAVFALERVLLVDPNNQRARVELARAYLLTNDLRRARREFNTVLKSNPPDNVKNNIQTLLTKITELEQSRDKKVSGFVEMRAGWDSNINSATDDEYFEIGILRAFLDRDSRELEDSFVETIGEVTHQRKLPSGRGYFGKLRGSTRQNLSEEFDVTNASISAGAIVQSNKNRLVRLPVRYQNIRLDNNTLRNTFSVGMEWTERAGTSANSFFGNVFAYRYPGNAVMDVNGVSAGYARMQSSAEKPKLSFNYVGLAGYEAAEQDLGDHLARGYLAARAGVRIAAANKQEWNASLVAQLSRYNDSHPVFAKTREDLLGHLQLGWRRALSKAWSVDVQAAYTYNDSNISVYSFDRAQLSIGTRVAF